MVDVIGGAVRVMADRVENRNSLSGDVEPGGAEGQCVFGVSVSHVK